MEKSKLCHHPDLLAKGSGGALGIELGWKILDECWTDCDDM